MNMRLMLQSLKRNLRLLIQKKRNTLVLVFRLIRARNVIEPVRDLSPNHKIIDLDMLASISLLIPGMVAPRSGEILYTLCYMQELQGDVVEIGSWQGRSTSFLGRAVANSNNGTFYAIDHFGENVGKGETVVKENEQLSDLKRAFLNNMKRIGLDKVVCLLDMSSELAAKKIGHKGIRMLFIDGNHTKEGVQKDIELFFPLLLKGALVIFDDYSNRFPGLVEAVNELLESRTFTRTMSYHNTLVLKL